MAEIGQYVKKVPSMVLYRLYVRYSWPKNFSFLARYCTVVNLEAIGSVLAAQYRKSILYFIRWIWISSEG